MPTRSGSTWKELALGVLVICTLCGFLLLIVCHVREMANRVGCQNRLQRIGMALLTHHEIRGVFPGEGGYINEPECLFVRGVGNDELRLGLGVPYATPEAQPGSWLYQILPYLTHDPPIQTRGPRPNGCGLAVKNVLCPSRGRPELIETPAVDPLFPGVGYESNPAGQTLWGRTDFAGNGRLLSTRGGAMVRISNVRPGLANAILVGEKALDPRAYDGGGWLMDGPALVGGPTCVRDGTTVSRDRLDPELSLDSPELSGWGAAHYHGAHFLFAAGQIRLIHHGISDSVLERLLGPSDGIGNND